MRDESVFSETICLALETSTPQVAATLGRGPRILETRTGAGPRRQSVDLLPIVAALCRSHQAQPSAIGCVFVSSGPGSFTGLRLGTTLARTLSLSTGCRLVDVPTLQVVAHNTLDAEPPPDQVAVLVDARRGHVFAAEFVRAADWFETTRPVAEVPPGPYLAELASRSPRAAILGGGAAAYSDAVRDSGLRRLSAVLDAPRADVVYRLGLSRLAAGSVVSRRSLVPLYVRLPDAEEKWVSRRDAGR